MARIIDNQPKFDEKIRAKNKKPFANNILQVQFLDSDFTIKSKRYHLCFRLLFTFFGSWIYMVFLYGVCVNYGIY